jgi:hypothetical protein
MGLLHMVNFASDVNWPYPAEILAISVIVLLLRQIHARGILALHLFARFS